MDKMKSASVGIVGCGNIAGDLDDDLKKRHIYSHAKAISMVEALKLVVCCDVDESALRKYAERWDVPGQYKKVVMFKSVGMGTIQRT
ncbi:hypothetical protein ISS37_03930 [candidate division KSB1 bacterium]|nr:hypothetical protein [candidate division KSB1 bacterium]